MLRWNGDFVATIYIYMLLNTLLPHEGPESVWLPLWDTYVHLVNVGIYEGRRIGPRFVPIGPMTLVHM